MASVVVLGIAVLSAKAYDHSGRHYAEGREPAGSSRVFALVYRYLQASSIGVALGSLWFESAWLMPLHSALPVAMAGLDLAVVAAAFFLGSKAALGREYSPCFDAFMPGELVERGPYRLIRHPIYTANIALLLALAVAADTGWLVVNAIVLTVFYREAAIREERELAEAWPAYRDYAARTGRFLPGLGRLPKDDAAITDG